MTGILRVFVFVHFVQPSSQQTSAMFALAVRFDPALNLVNNLLMPLQILHPALSPAISLFLILSRSLSQTLHPTHFSSFTFLPHHTTLPTTSYRSSATCCPFLPPSSCQEGGKWVTACQLRHDHVSCLAGNEGSNDLLSASCESANTGRFYLMWAWSKADVVQGAQDFHTDAQEGVRKLDVESISYGGSNILPSLLL